MLQEGDAVGDPALVARDVRCGYYTVAEAADGFGVVLDPETLAIIYLTQTLSIPGSGSVRIYFAKNHKATARSAVVPTWNIFAQS